MRKQTRREFLKAVGFAAPVMAMLPGCLVSGGPPAGTERRPNVVLVMTDDQGYGDLACHGNGVIQTPNLDRLYRRSVRLTDFHVGPTCSPTRAALMTGRYCNRTGVWHTIMGRSLLRRDEVTMADVFRAGGYRTGIFGKWHLGDNYPYRPNDRGFDEALVHKGGGIGNTQDYWGNDYFDDTYFRNGKAEKFRGYCTDVWFTEAMKFIEANRDRPFLCYLPTNAPHSPYRVPEKYSRMYEGKGVNAGFYGMITNIDENMGRLMKRLDELGLADNTILIFMTDNGSSEPRYNAAMRGNKGDAYDGGHRVPFFIRWPEAGIGGGKDVERLTAHIDVLPTLIELCGLARPSGVQFDGKSIVSLLKGKTRSWPERTIITDSQRIEHPKKWRKSAVMTDRRRLVNGKELYDIKADPGQKNDVSSKYPDVVEKLRSDYESWWTDTSRRFGEYCAIVLGSAHENPTMLSSHDWHADGPWNQEQIRRGLRKNSFWAVEVACDGEYEISLRRWPVEANAAITAAADGGKAIAVKKARLKIADFDQTKDVSAGDKAVTFRMRLKTGKARLQSWFIEADDRSRGAYYVYVKRLG